MIEEKFRSPFQKVFVEPLVNAPLLKTLSPKTVTLFSAATGITSCFCFHFLWIYTGIFSLLLSGYLDLLDGSIARAYEKSSDEGAVLDIFSDRLVEFSVIFALYSIDPIQRGALCLLLLGSCFLCVTSFLVVGIFSENQSKKSFHYSPGIIERAEAFIFFILLFAFPKYFFFLGYLLTSLILLTTFIRLYQFSKNC